MSTTIDEERLRELLDVAATEAPLPSPDASELIAALAGDAPPPAARPPQLRRRWAIAIPVLAAALAVIVGAGVLINVGDRNGALYNRPTGATIAEDVATNQYTRQASQSAGAAQAVTDAPKIVKTGSVELEVRKRQFSLTIERLTALATGVSGYVAKSETSETATVPHGTVTLRVPEASFDDVIGRVRRLGKVHSISSQAADVTAEFTDRDTRLRALTVERDQLLTILADARTIPDILAVRDRSTRVQTEIEQLQGQQRLLDDQASLATLAVTVAEPGRGGLESLDQERSGLSGAWHDAVDRFVGGVEAIVAASGTILLVLLCLGAIGLAGHATWRFSRRRMV